MLVLFVYQHRVSKASSLIWSIIPMVHASDSQSIRLFPRLKIYFLWTQQLYLLREFSLSLSYSSFDFRSTSFVSWWWCFRARSRSPLVRKISYQLHYYFPLLRSLFTSSTGWWSDSSIMNSICSKYMRFPILFFLYSIFFPSPFSSLVANPAFLSQCP
jgi:hypothetical protein